ncbi:MAG: 2,3-bisphosphoglycerate-independent phosphoglycerate mutase [Candidatus Jorgensenbacteria bacterium GW2011_GWA1_48_13]|uniref:2,3-bisphosphoglycerate-independent phosphoglycerate mutase n=2 Tax=Candidatus Joergenseniibacteriota TaxID=1752739 RepID=A0A0G1YK10_9BACT|nr:MAG: 2,3-bisphosphoglycerate-independent phosphoglycerate mutase [Candidatus Jorgensenbacteria bacterium GW2011_GWA1_48_13]KKW15342.1 MAG: 2,3-bisphosphoglycerate-independent phosphoglycerate mutase [Candidatus Jorgensenbacteria bacterium GW2011_GWB1_50_10]
MKRTYVLTILDGWGLGKLIESNPIHAASPETIKFLESSFPAAALQASGVAIGLPFEEEGNSEVGHLTLGAGKIIYQHYPRIMMKIEDGSFFKNKFLKEAFARAREKNSAVHLAGLLTSGNVHASFRHLAALIEMAKRESCQNLFIHVFADGKDSPPRSFMELLGKLKAEVQKNGVGTIASVAGRYYAMDRDGHWDRTEAAYKALTGDLPISAPEEAVKSAYTRELDDEFIEPTAFEAHAIKDGDALIFFNFREDSMRQIAESFLNPKLDKFPIKIFSNLYIVTMTAYEDKWRARVAFPSERVGNPLGKVLADKGLNQLRIAETEKYAHVTYFFNGGREKPYPNEFRVLVPSKTAVREEEHPEMMASAVTDRAIVALNEGGFDFILVNYANPDIIAHTGNYDAAVQAIKTVDKELNRLVDAVLKGNHVMIVTSDHGNAEEVLNPRTGEPETKHNANPVPIYLVGKDFQKPKPEEILHHPETIGLLADVAPTILELMNIPKPPEMTGQSLLNQLI